MTIRLLNITTNINAPQPYLLQGLQVPQTIYRAYISVARSETETTQLDANRQYWVKSGAGPLRRLRLDFQEIKTAPAFIDDIAIDLDSFDATDNPLRLYVGDTEGTAVELDHAPAPSVRFRCIFSLG